MDLESVLPITFAVVVMVALSSVIIMYGNHQLAESEAYRSTCESVNGVFDESKESPHYCFVYDEQGRYEMFHVFCVSQNLGDYDFKCGVGASND